jgi:hypothetical protein
MLSLTPESTNAILDDESLILVKERLKYRRIVLPGVAWDCRGVDFNLEATLKTAESLA